MAAFIVSGATSKFVQEVETLENSRVMSKPISPEALLRLAPGAIESALFKFTEIEKGQFDRFLDFVSELTCEQHP